MPNLRTVAGSFGTVLRRYAFGIDERPLDLGGEAKSISSENTFLRDTADRRVLRRTLREQAAEIAAELREKRLAARTIQVTVRYGDFTRRTRQATFEEGMTEAEAIYRLGCHLLARHKMVNRPLRLIGLGVSHLGTPQGQLRLPGVE